MLIQFPIKREKKETWVSLLQSDSGLPYAKNMKGFISAEYGFSDNENTGLIWHLWEKWETKEDYLNYDASPQRQEGSKFMDTVIDCLVSYG